MTTKRIHWLPILATLGLASAASAADAEFAEVPADVLADKTAGGLLGQLLGNLNGLPHENKYIAGPGNVSEYVPSLPAGAWTDDDTDIEWVYVVEMQRTGEPLIPPPRIVELWRTHINERIWCANLYARGLMNLGIEPPWTGRLPVNPWSGFNVSGQFLCEAFGLVAPAMPQTASTISLHYTEVAIDGEPAQTTQLFAGMIATAFVTSDVGQILNAGRLAVDPKSEIRRIIGDVQGWWKAHPHDWRETRRQILTKYARHGGDIVDRNGCVLNTAAIVGALLHGRGDFVETLRLAFNFGWDADCNAATAATVLGVIKGRRWMAGQKWAIGDRYENRTRPGMPTDETISRYGERLADIARTVILANGGAERRDGDRRVFRIRVQKPANVRPLVSPGERLAELRNRFLPGLDKDLAADARSRARAAYLAICLGESQRLRNERPADWARAIKELQKHADVVKSIAKAPGPDGAALRSKAAAAGLRLPPTGE